VRVGGSRIFRAEKKTQLIRYQFLTMQTSQRSHLMVSQLLLFPRQLWCEARLGRVNRTNFRKMKRTIYLASLSAFSLAVTALAQPTPTPYTITEQGEHLSTDIPNATIAPGLPLISVTSLRPESWTITLAQGYSASPGFSTVPEPAGEIGINSIQGIPAFPGYVGNQVNIPPTPSMITVESDILTKIIAADAINLTVTDPSGVVHPVNFVDNVPDNSSTAALSVLSMVALAGLARKRAAQAA
jgi:hypothetical protein